MKLWIVINLFEPHIKDGEFFVYSGKTHAQILLEKKRAEMRAIGIPTEAVMEGSFLQWIDTKTFPKHNENAEDVKRAEGTGQPLPLKTLDALKRAIEAEEWGNR